MSKENAKNIYKEKLREAIEKGCHDEYKKVTGEPKRAAIPDKLYRYTPLTSYSVDNLLNKRFYLNKPNGFNDPFDCHYMSPASYFALVDLLQLPAHDSDLQTRFYDIMNKGLDSKHFEHNTSIEENTGVTCFTENNPEKIIMWSHYAAYHKGMCLEYDFSQCNAEIFTMLLPVLYENELIFKESKSKDPRVTFYFDVIQTCLIKSKEWEYENEWRIINPNCYSENDFNLPCFNPSSILLGLNSSLQGEIEDKGDYKNRMIFIDKIKNFAGRNKIPVYQMKRSADLFKLTPEKIALS